MERTIARKLSLRQGERPWSRLKRLLERRRLRALALICRRVFAREMTRHDGVKPPFPCPSFPCHFVSKFGFPDFELMQPRRPDEQGCCKLSASGNEQERSAQVLTAFQVSSFWVGPNRPKYLAQLSGTLESNPPLLALGRCHPNPTLSQVCWDDAATFPAFEALEDAAPLPPLTDCPRTRIGLIFASHARVAQLDRASASGAEGCGFDPRLAHQSSI